MNLQDLLNRYPDSSVSVSISELAVSLHVKPNDRTLSESVWTEQLDGRTPERTLGDVMDTIDERKAQGLPGMGHGNRR